LTILGYNFLPVLMDKLESVDPSLHILSLKAHFPVEFQGISNVLNVCFLVRSTIKDTNGMKHTVTCFATEDAIRIVNWFI
jgi:hypothetical protein